MPLSGLAGHLHTGRLYWQKQTHIHINKNKGCSWEQPLGRWAFAAFVNHLKFVQIRRAYCSPGWEALNKGSRSSILVLDTSLCPLDWSSEAQWGSVQATRGCSSYWDKQALCFSAERCWTLPLAFQHTWPSGWICTCTPSFVLAWLLGNLKPTSCPRIMIMFSVEATEFYHPFRFLYVLSWRIPKRLALFLKANRAPRVTEPSILQKYKTNLEISIV